MQTAERLLSDSRSSKRLILARETFVRICFRILTPDMPQQHAGRTEICFSKQGSQNSDSPSARTSLRLACPAGSGLWGHRMKVKAYSSVMQQCGSRLSPAYHSRRTPTAVEQGRGRVEQHRRRSSGLAPRFPQRQASAGRSFQPWPLTCCRASRVRLVRSNPSYHADGGLTVGKRRSNNEGGPWPGVGPRAARVSQRTEDSGHSADQFHVAHVRRLQPVG